ncbi:chemotaxis protein CheD [Paenibacillus senegalensis]|uniref:chemotaxis protein CheD n=1 Tax=Paenibacillus senegalensis TaxID=1465766 RepID=UPI00028A2A39|nr:chemotaxis protein CheD [Paenibacillus senegalensis]
MKVLIKVGMADLNVAGREESLRSTGLGSCVGVALFDPRVKVAGLAHVMLPQSSIAVGKEINKAKFADTAIPELIRLMQEKGAKAECMVGKLAGGSQMFTLGNREDTIRIGPRNVETCKAILQQYGIPITAEDTGGNYGRTIELDGSTGILHIRSVQHGSREI